MKNRNSLTNFVFNAKSVFKRDAIIYVIVIVLSLVVAAIAEIYELTGNLELLIYFNLFRVMGMACLASFMAYYFFHLILQRHPHPMLAYWQRLKTVLSRPEEIIGFLLLMTALSVVFSSFTSLKTMVPVIKPYQYDELFMQIDLALHMGFDPWQITHEIFSHPIATAFINILYNIWFVLCWSILIVFMVRLNSNQQRQQFLLSFILCWILIGGLLATILSSAGPCFYSDISNGSEHYQPLMKLLNNQQQWLNDHVPWLSIWALDTQEMLWNQYIESQTSIGSGISAMPSMHVSIAVLMALAISSLNRKVGVLFWIYALIIQIGSVHLAWHYAIDGYVSAFFTIIIWKVVGYFYEYRKAIYLIKND